jgi:adenosylcobinamide kinase / adenosylcobinamide-phosphate guanylyltransferase
MIVLVLGGARSGKSEIAEQLIERWGPSATYIATWTPTPEVASDPGSAVRPDSPDDPNMAERIARHRRRRPSGWSTVESGLDLVGAVRSVRGPILVDSLGTWVAAHHDFAVNVTALCDVLRAHNGAIVIVSDETGLGVHPSSQVGRLFRDALGEVNRCVADIADRVLLVVAGRVLELDRFNLDSVAKGHRA